MTTFPWALLPEKKPPLDNSPIPPQQPTGKKKPETAVPLETTHPYREIPVQPTSSQTYFSPVSLHRGSRYRMSIRRSIVNIIFTTPFKQSVPCKTNRSKLTRVRICKTIAPARKQPCDSAEKPDKNQAESVKNAFLKSRNRHPASDSIVPRQKIRQTVRQTSRPSTRQPLNPTA